MFIIFAAQVLNNYNNIIKEYTNVRTLKLIEDDELLLEYVKQIQNWLKNKEVIVNDTLIEVLQSFDFKNVRFYLCYFVPLRSFFGADRLLIHLYQISSLEKTQLKNFFKILIKYSSSNKHIAAVTPATSNIKPGILLRQQKMAVQLEKLTLKIFEILSS